MVFNIKTKEMVTFINLFLGYGDFIFGFIKAIFKPLLFVDISNDCFETSKLNRKNITTINDDFKNPDLIVFKGKAASLHN
jgi:site-specific DNA-cytosine methylase